jgi:hypothetical protein
MVSPFCGVLAVTSATGVVIVTRSGRRTSEVHFLSKKYVHNRSLTVKVVKSTQNSMYILKRKKNPFFEDGIKVGEPHIDVLDG